MAQLGFSDVGDEGVQSKQARSQVDMSENSKNKVSEGSSQISVPRRSLSVEFFVGVFATLPNASMLMLIS